MSGWWNELAHVWRSLTWRGNRLANGVLALILASGVTTSTCVFGVVDALLIRALPFPAAGELVNVALTTPRERSRSHFRTVANLGLYGAWSREAADLITVAGFQTENAVLVEIGKARTVQVVGITTNMMALLGVPPLYGRSLVEADDARGAVRTLVLSYGLWARIFGEDPGAIGRTLTLNDLDFRVVGVMPRGFRVPLSIPDTMQGQDEIWVSVHAAQEIAGASPGDLSYPLEVIGRVRPGTPLQPIEAKLTGIARKVLDIAEARQSGDGAPDAVEVNHLKDVSTEFIRTPLTLVSVAVGLLLLLACFNAANLFVARAIAHERETQVRIALGASRSRIALRWALEGMAVSLLGWLLGAGLAYVGISYLRALGAVVLPDVGAVAFNLRTLGFSLILAVITGAVAGAPAAIMARDSSSNSVLATRVGIGRRTRRAMRAAVAFQIGLGVVLGTSVGVLGSSFLRLARMDRGYEMKNVVGAGFLLPSRSYADAGAARAFRWRLLNELRRSPDLAFPAVLSGAPFFGGTSGTASAAERSSLPGRIVSIWSVAGEYFQALKIPVLRGREPNFNANPDAVALDEAAARALFGGESPLGRRITWGARKNVGVVTAVTGSMQEVLPGPEGNSLRSVKPHIYVSAMRDDSRVVRVLARAIGNPPGALESMERAIAGVDQRLPVEAQTLEGMLATQLAKERFLITVVAVFALLAIILAATGVFAAMAYLTEQRKHEIGVRLALGASPSGIVLLVLGDALRIAGAGGTAGVLGALGIARLMRSLVFEISPLDPATILGAVLFCAAASILASKIPASRAARVHPAATLLGGN